jgi:hypothetical protein
VIGVLGAFSAFGNHWAHEMAINLITVYFFAAAYTVILAIPYLLIGIIWKGWKKKRKAQ